MHGVCANTNPLRADKPEESLSRLDDNHGPKQGRGSFFKFHFRNFPNRVNRNQFPPINFLT